MKKALFVYIEDSFSELLGYEANFALLQFGAFFFAVSHEFIQIFFYVLEYEIGLVDDSDDFFEFDYVGVVHLPERLDLRQLQTLLPSAVLLLQSFYG